MKKIILTIAFTIIILISMSMIIHAETWGDYEYALNKDNTITITRYLGNESIVNIPDMINGYKVTSIDGYSNYIEDGTNHIIEYGAFSYCSNLTTVNIPHGITSIGHSVFYGCSSLATVSIPDGITTIGAYAFYGCSNLVTIGIPDSVTSIGGYAFYGCSSLNTINIPYGVTSIGDGTFYGCSSLATINIDEGITSIGNSAFRDCSSLVTVNIPDSVTNISWGAFYGCSSLVTVNIPYGVTSIIGYTFRDCSSLGTVNIPDSVTTIGYDAFRDCSSLVTVNIPDSVTSIGDGTFYGCSSLATINIPNSITSIGYAAFCFSSNLSTVIFNGNAPSISTNAFSGCSPYLILYFYEDTEGWTTHTGNGYKTQMIPGSPPVTEDPPPENEYYVLPSVSITYDGNKYITIIYGNDGNPRIEPEKIDFTLVCTNVGNVLDLPDPYNNKYNYDKANAENVTLKITAPEFININGSKSPLTYNIGGLKFEDEKTVELKLSFANIPEDIEEFNVTVEYTVDDDFEPKTSAFTFYVNVTDTSNDPDHPDFPFDFHDGLLLNDYYTPNGKEIKARDYTLKKDLKINKDIKLPQGCSIYVIGNIDINANVSMSMNSSLSCSNNINIDATLSMNKNSTLSCSNNITVEKNGILDLSKSGKVSAGKNFIFNSNKDHTTKLTDGTISLSSNLEIKTPKNFKCSGSNVVEFMKDVMHYLNTSVENVEFNKINISGWYNNIKLSKKIICNAISFINPKSVGTSYEKSFIELDKFKCSPKKNTDTPDTIYSRIQTAIALAISNTNEIDFNCIPFIAIPFSFSGSNQSIEIKDFDMNGKLITYTVSVNYMGAKSEESSLANIIGTYEDTNGNKCDYMSYPKNKDITNFQKTFNNALTNIGIKAINDFNKELIKACITSSLLSLAPKNFTVKGMITFNTKDTVNKVIDILLKMETNEIIKSYENKTVKVNCPVDVYVYNENNVLVGKIVDNNIDYDILREIDMSVIGDIKEIYFPKYGDYTIEIIATDTGVLDYFIYEYDELGTETMRTNFHNISLYNGKKFVGNIDDTFNETPDKYALKVYENGINTATILPSISTFDNDIEEVYITVTSSLGGEVIQNNVYQKGDLVSLLAISETGYTFDGWYENNVKLDNVSSKYTFTALTNRTLEARFIARNNFNITGTVSSYNATNPINISLWQNGIETEYTTVIQGQSSSENKTYNQAFILEDIPDGTYDLVITKQGHLQYTVKNIVINGSDINISSYVISLVAGDVNGNGAVNLNDVSEIAKSTRFNKVESNKNGYDPIYDVNGNGVIELTDISIAFNSYNFQKTTSNCNIEFSEVLSKINP